MRYTKEQIQALRKRWGDKLLKPDSFTRDENGKVHLNDEYEGNQKAAEQPLDETCWFYKRDSKGFRILHQKNKIETFQDLLSTRSKEIQGLILAKIEQIDKSLDWENKRREYQKAWEKPADNGNSAKGVFWRTLKDLRDYGLENYYPDLTDVEKTTLKREIAIDFRGADFTDFYFDGVDCGFAHFDGAICLRTYFRGADLYKANFVRADCRRVHFDGALCFIADFEGAECRSSYFNGADLRGALFKYANLNFASIENTILTSVKHEKGNYLYLDTRNVDWSKNPRMKRFIEHQQMVEGVIGKNWFSRYVIPGGAWWLFADYGRSLLRWTAWLFGFILLFGMGFAELWDQFVYKSFPPEWSTFPYFSIVTISTLGFGDITPLTGNARLLVSAEVIVGYIMLGGLVTFLANWLGRR